VETEKQKVSSYYLLQRTNRVKKIKITPLNKSIASYATYLITKGEYGATASRLRWSEYNALFDERINPVARPDELYEQWRADLDLVFGGINTYLIEIPVNINHSEFMEFFRKYFLSIYIR
jgi:hypothetical protein